MLVVVRRADLFDFWPVYTLREIVHKSRSRIAALPPSIVWSKARHRALGTVLGRYSIDLNRDIAHGLVIAGTHRSGSTWLADLVNSQLHYRLIFEPVEHSQDPAIAAINRVYLRPGTENPYVRERFANMVTGLERSYNLDKHNAQLICRGRLIKGVSMGLMLKWFRTEFPLVPMLFIVRNPLLYVASSLRMDWLQPIDPEFWLNQADLVADHLGPYVDLIESARTDAEKFTLEWCILNAVPLSQFMVDEWHVVVYDDVVSSPERSLRDIFTYLERPFTDAILARVEVPSHTAEESVQDRTRLLVKWREVLGADDEVAIRRYVEAFGLERYLGGA